LQHEVQSTVASAEHPKEQNFQLELSDEDSKQGVGHVT
jgi:hypothetical protein